jgi:hypothetical protein
MVNLENRFGRKVVLWTVFGAYDGARYDVET